MASAPPLTINVTRGKAVESSHVVHAVLLDGEGRRRAVYGNAERPTYPRSALKPLQALALVETGAAAAAGLSNAEIALASASHSGEEKHVSAVLAWLARLGLSEEALECGAHAPYATPCTPAAVAANNCSGKHSGMLTLTQFLGAPVQGYTQFTHPTQLKILATLSEMCGLPLTPEVCGIDGCSAPNALMPLESMARGFARFMNPAKESFARGVACRLIFQSMTEHPDLVAGTGRIDTLLMTAARGAIMAKIGGEAVHALVIPAKDTVIALKCEDGNSRASQAAVVALLEKHDLAEAPVLDAIRGVACPILRNWRGLDVGRIEIAAN